MAKETIMQFGEGGFLRGFVDYFIHKMNESGLYDGKVVVIQPIETGMVDQLNKQKGEYNLFLRGKQDGQIVNEHTHIQSISRAINPYTDFDAYMKLAENKDLRVIVSNTTEAGIEYVGTEKITDAPAKSYPAKLTQFLYKRFTLGLPGFILLPCELIEHNADSLKECILKYAQLWELPQEFTDFILKENEFCNTLVDRITTGYPKDEVKEFEERIGYEDRLIDTAEIFHLWVIEGNHEKELPFQKAGFNVVWTEDVAPYKKRKVRILNGGHTSMVLGAFLYGLHTVGECMSDQTVSTYLKKCMFDEIIPVLGNSETDIQFGKDVLERFSNPFIKHQLLSIALNSVSKFEVRVLPTILEYKDKFGVYPEGLTMSLAALIAFYKTDNANDSKEIMEFMKASSVEDILRKQEYWKCDLSELSEIVTRYYQIIEEQGMKAAYEAVLKKKIIQIQQNDNVAVALQDIICGEKLRLRGYTIQAKEDIHFGHKVALKDIACGERIIKYGHKIAYASQDIHAGEWVHVHNVRTTLEEDVSYEYNRVENIQKRTTPAFFKGYERKDGRVGVRNEIWIVPTVGCVNNIVKILEQKTKNLVHDGVEDVVSFSHPYGCSQMGEDQENTRKVLANLIKHPNAGAVLVVSLGCENCNLSVMNDYIQDCDKERIRFLECQNAEDEISEGIKIIEELIEVVSKDQRTPISADRLVVGLKCGGSDGLSGVTANPVVGEFSDLLISKGGTTILTEVPEMFGAEQILMNHCENRELFEETVHLIKNFKNYFMSYGQTVYENPSPGNKAGGISTLEDKSSGCIQKAGHTMVKGVLQYAQVVKEKGLNLLSAPGNDLVSSTALGISGAHIVLFTTGRGTPFTSMVPTVKISSNTSLAERKSNWIDFDAGRAVQGMPISVLADELLDYVLRVASGERVKAEESGLREIAIFKQGVTL